MSGMLKSNFEDEFNKSIWIYPNVTLRCNRVEEARGCDHCYLNHRKELCKGVMGYDTVNKLSEVYSKHIGKYGESKFNKVTIYGGEPLLYPDLVKKIITNFRAISPAMNILIFTNGDFLNEELLTWTKERNVRINLSVNDDSIEEVEKKLALVRAFGKLGIMVLVMCEKNLTRLKELFVLSHKNDAVIKIVYDFIKTGSKYMEMCEKIVPEVMQWIVDEKYVFNPEAFFSLFTLKNKDKFYNYCGSSHFYAVDPDGSVLGCQCVGNKIGDIYDEPFDFLKLRKPPDSLVWNCTGIAECEACEYKLICGGGCPLRKQICYGRSDVVSPTCKIDKKVIPLLLKMKKTYEEVNHERKYSDSEQ